MSCTVTVNYGNYAIAAKQKMKIETKGFMANESTHFVINLKKVKPRSRYAIN